MNLNRAEQERLSQIARGLARDDPGLARKLGGSGTPAVTQAGMTFELLVIATITVGLALAAVGVRWQLPVCIGLGIVGATVGPIIVGLILSPRHH